MRCKPHTRELAGGWTRFKTLFEAIGDAIFVHEVGADGRPGRFVEVNLQAVRHTGYAREELLALSPAALDAPDSGVDRGPICARIRAGEAVTFEQVHLSRDGRRIPVEIHARMFELDGRPMVLSIVRDITERKRVAAELHQAHVELQLFRNLLDHASDGIEVVEPGTLRFLDVNDKECGDLGYSRAEMLAMTVYDIDPVYTPEINARTEALLRETGRVRVEGVHRRKDGSCFDVEVSVAWVPLEKPYILAIVRDVSERKRTERQLRLAASVFQHSHEGIILTDAQARILDVNAAFTRITGYARDEVVGRNPSMLKSGHQDAEFYAAMWATLNATGFWQGEVWNRRRDGEVYPELLTISAVADAGGVVHHYVGVFADISLIKQHERQLERIAHYDALTQLPNRILLADRMRQALAQAERARTLVGVGYLDLDGFKAVNDRLGHAAGDRLLMEVARRLRQALRAGDTVARLGGDEFVLLLVGLKSVAECEEALGRVLHSLAEPFPLEGTTARISASIGFVLYPENGDDADTLLRHADVAMYEAKQAGRNRYRRYRPARERH